MFLRSTFVLNELVSAYLPDLLKNERCFEESLDNLGLSAFK